jgi:hypothetical protein
MIFGVQRSSSRARSRTALLIASLLAGPVLAGCESTDVNPDAGTAIHGNIVLTDKNNYKATSVLTIPHVKTTPGANLDVSWAGVTKDLLCHDVNPAADIDDVTFLQISGLTADQVQKRFGSGQAITKYVDQFFDFPVDHSQAGTSTRLATFSTRTATTTTPLVPAQDYVIGSGFTYMILFAHGTTIGSNSRSMVFIDPTDGESNTDVAGASGCDILDFTADITTPTPLDVPKGGPWVADWSQLKHDGLSNTVVYSGIDQVLLAYYSMSVAEVQKRFLDVQIMATSMYKIDIPPDIDPPVKHMNLAAAVSDAEGDFPGFDRTDGTWALALMCTTCQAPSPIAFVILNPT